MTQAQFTIEKDTQGRLLRLAGKLDVYHAHRAHRLLERALATSPHTILDAAGLTRLDTAGALLLRQCQEKKQLEIRHLAPEHAALFDLVSQTPLALPPPVKRPPPVLRFIRRIGERTIDGVAWTKKTIAFIGQAYVTLSRAIGKPKHLRLPDITHHIEDTGIDAIPIISVMAFMIAVVLAYQGVAQLRPMGAEYLTINLVAISVLREMGVLLTAIMVAGRSGSAFTAEIGVMEVREEVDALRVIGIDPFEVLVMPRLIALLIVLPLLTFIADMMGLLGGGVMSWLLIGIPLPDYMDRLQQVAHGRDFLVGMIKAPVFACLIAMVGCLHGLKVSGSAESVGRETTASVVKSIFLVLGADALFSIFFNKVGL